MYIVYKEEFVAFRYELGGTDHMESAQICPSYI